MFRMLAAIVLLLAVAGATSLARADGFLSFDSECEEQGIRVTYWVSDLEGWPASWAGARFFRTPVLPEGPREQVGPDFVPRSTSSPNIVEFLDTSADRTVTYQYGYELVDESGNPLLEDPAGEWFLTSCNYVSCEGPILLGHGQVVMSSFDAVESMEECPGSPSGVGADGAILTCLIGPPDLIQTGDTVALYGDVCFETDILVRTASVCVKTACPNVATRSSTWSAEKAKF